MWKNSSYFVKKNKTYFFKIRSCFTLLLTCFFLFRRDEDQLSESGENAGDEKGAFKFCVSRAGSVDDREDTASPPRMSDKEKAM